MREDRNSFVYSKGRPLLPISAQKSRFSPKILLLRPSLSSGVRSNFVYLLWRGSPHAATAAKSTRIARKRGATSLHLSFEPARYIPVKFPVRVIDNDFVAGLL